jgi:hypothetical protein
MSTDADQFAEPSVSLASSSGTNAVEDSNPMRIFFRFQHRKSTKSPYITG